MVFTDFTEDTIESIDTIDTQVSEVAIAIGAIDAIIAIEVSRCYKCYSIISIYSGHLKLTQSPRPRGRSSRSKRWSSAVIALLPAFERPNSAHESDASSAPLSTLASLAAGLLALFALSHVRPNFCTATANCFWPRVSARPSSNIKSPVSKLSKAWHSWALSDGKRTRKEQAEEGNRRDNKVKARLVLGQIIASLLPEHSQTCGSSVGLNKAIRKLCSSVIGTGTWLSWACTLPPFPWTFFHMLSTVAHSHRSFCGLPGGIATTTIPDESFSGTGPPSFAPWAFASFCSKCQAESLEVRWPVKIIRWESKRSEWKQFHPF